MCPGIQKTTCTASAAPGARSRSATPSRIFTAEEIDHVRSIERFIGAGIPRLKLENFPYVYTAVFNEDKIPAGGPGKGVRTLGGYSFGGRRRR